MPGKSNPVAPDSRDSTCTDAPLLRHLPSPAPRVTRVTLLAIEIKNAKCSASAYAQLLLVQEYLRLRHTGEPLPCHLLTAWQAFYADYTPIIRRVAACSGLRAENLEDCVQEAWISLLAELPSLDFDPHRSRFNTWLSTIVRRRAVDQIRRARRQTATSLQAAEVAWRPGPSGARASSCEQDDELERLAALLTALRARVSATSYWVFHLRRIEGHPVAEVAHLTGLTPPQVRARHHRAEEKLHVLVQRAERTDQTADRPISNAIDQF